MYPAGFTRLFKEVASGRCSLTIGELADCLQLDGDLGTLGKVSKIQAILREHGLRAIPDLTKGELDTVRTILFDEKPVSDAETLAADLNGNENPRLEFKSTLRFDLKRYDNMAEPRDEQSCVSDEVVLSTLKTISAFANTDGGRLYIGVSDDRKICGLAWDFKLRQTPDIDKFELHFRDLMKSRFKDGAMVNDYVELAFVPHDGMLVARIDVTPRSQLTFVVHAKQHLLYRRQGNRTLAVEIYEMEEFVCARLEKQGRFRNAATK